MRIDKSGVLGGQRSKEVDGGEVEVKGSAQCSRKVHQPWTEWHACEFGRPEVAGPLVIGSSPDY